MSKTQKKIIAFELKSRKQNQVINLGEVGQCHNHLEWCQSSHGKFDCLGLIIVGSLAHRTRSTAPSNEMWHINTVDIQVIFKEYVNLLFALQKMPPLDRYAEISAMCVRPEWQMDGIFHRIRGGVLSNLPVKE
jgi:hypothetical protein